MLDQIARTRGSSSADPDLERATGFLQFPPDIWIWQPSRSLLPTVPSESQYRDGLAALGRYNARLAAGNAVFERRADTLAGTLSRIAADLGSQAAQLERAQRTGIFGSPSFIVDGELFWGDDRLEDAIAWARKAGRG